MGFRYEVRLDAAALSARMDAGARRAAASAGETIRQAACARAPVRTGALVGSSRSAVSGYTARVSFGVPYAAIRHARGRGSGYLSGVMDSEAGKILLACLEREMGGGR